MIRDVCGVHFSCPSTTRSPGVDLNQTYSSGVRFCPIAPLTSLVRGLLRAGGLVVGVCGIPSNASGLGYE